MAIRKNDQQLGEVLFEISVIGASARVAVIHVASNIEVVAICPARLPRASMEQVGLRKLKFILERNKNPKSQ
jgi:hypothetical protein